MFKTSMGKRGTLFSEESGFKFLSIGEVKVKQKAIASTLHFPFPHKLKLRMVQSQALREEAEMIHAPSLTHRNWNFSAVWEPDALLAPKVRRGDG